MPAASGIRRPPHARLGPDLDARPTPPPAVFEPPPAVIPEARLLGSSMAAASRNLAEGWLLVNNMMEKRNIRIFESVTAFYAPRPLTRWRGIASPTARPVA